MRTLLTDGGIWMAAFPTPLAGNTEFVTGVTGGVTGTDKVARLVVGLDGELQPAANATTSAIPASVFTCTSVGL